MSDRLTREVGRLAGRLAEFLAETFPRPAGATAQGIDFLRRSGAAAGGGPQDSDAVGEPLDSLAARLGLSALERDFLLLVGMPEEHEGYALAMRALHPRGEPRPSVALAAQFLWRDGSRGDFLRWLEGSALRRSGAVRLTGDAPYFERSVELAESLWPTLHGCDPAAPGPWHENGVALPTGWELTRPTATWDQLVISPEREDVLRAAAVRLGQQRRVFDEWGLLGNRPDARGVRLLFGGPPGTGKTLAAEVLAAERKIGLLAGSAACLFSERTGETERNLDAVFDAAARTPAALCFDGAEVLFTGKNAPPAPAGLAAASLLTRLKHSTGLVVFAVERRRDLDPAFVRQMDFVVDFREPDAEERRRLWRIHLPDPSLLAGDVDLSELAARYPLAGDLICRVALDAAFQAAEAGGKISRSHLVRSLRWEYARNDLAFPEPSDA